MGCDRQALDIRMRLNGCLAPPSETFLTFLWLHLGQLGLAFPIFAHIPLQKHQRLPSLFNRRAMSADSSNLFQRASKQISNKVAPPSQRQCASTIEP